MSHRRRKRISTRARGFEGSGVARFFLTCGAGACEPAQMTKGKHEANIVDFTARVDFFFLLRSRSAATQRHTDLSNSTDGPFDTFYFSGKYR